MTMPALGIFKISFLHATLCAGSPHNRLYQIKKQRALHQDPSSRARSLHYVPKSLSSSAHRTSWPSSPSPGTPLPTCGYTMIRGGAARAYIAAAPSAGGSGRPEERRTPWRPAHLLRPPRVLPGTRKWAVARRSRKDKRALGHFRFCLGGVSYAVMSRFKFVGKGQFSLVGDPCWRSRTPTSLRSLAFRGYRGCWEAWNTDNE